MTNVTLHKTTLITILVFGCIIGSYAQRPLTPDASVTQKFYSINHHQLFWFSSGKNLKKAAEWLKVIESSGHLGIQVDPITIKNIRTALMNRNALDGGYKEQADKQITELVLNYMRELQQGNISLDYDEISQNRDTLYIDRLLNSKFWESVPKIVVRLDCKDPDYQALKQYLRDSVAATDTLKYKAVVMGMNYRRYLTVNHPPEYILVNIPEAEAAYYQNDLRVLKMRVVVGKKKNPTPLIASNITSIVTFPHWNVPYQIAVTELLPKVQKNENYLEQNNFEIVDAKGNVVDDSDLNWSEYDTRNFPYFFKQATGADNSLGVLKFNLQNPFSIFLHSTSALNSFSKDFRFLSHGCVRLEKPFELADALLRGNIDLEALKGGKKDTESKTIKLPVKIPVFIIYMPVKVVGEQVTVLKDIYGLIK